MGIYKVNNQRKYRETDDGGSWESNKWKIGNMKLHTYLIK